MTDPTVPWIPIHVTDQERLRLSDHLEELLGHDVTGTLLRSLSPHGTAKPRLDPDIAALFDRFHELLGHDDAEVLIALLPLEPFRRRAARSSTDH